MGVKVITARNRFRLNNRLMECAVSRLPAILIDCANAADPHRYYPSIDLAMMQRIYVFELELLHKFRDVLRQVPLYAKRLQARIIVVTTSDHLLNYHNEQENRDIYIHAWQLMKQIGRSYHLVAGVSSDSAQYDLARQYGQEFEEI